MSSQNFWRYSCMVSKCDWQCHFTLIENRIQADSTERPFLVKRCDRTWVQSVIQLRTNIYGTVSNRKRFCGETCCKEFHDVTERLNVNIDMFWRGSFGVILGIFCVWLFSWIAARIVALCVSRNKENHLHANVKFQLHYTYAVGVCKLACVCIRKSLQIAAYSTTPQATVSSW